MEKNIGIFQADHGLQVHTTNVANGLVGAGYHVDIFLYNCASNYEDFANCRANIIDLSSEHHYWKLRPTLITKIFEATNYFIFKPLLLNPACLLPKRVIDKSFRIIAERKYTFLIGIEKLGLVWAGLVSNKFAIPYIYYSLELYPSTIAFAISNGIQDILKSLRFLVIRKFEKEFHHKSTATIVQDRFRATELMKMNNLQKATNLLVPITIAGAPYTKKGKFFIEKFGLSDNIKIALQFGVIGQNRLAEEVALAAQILPDDWVLVFHGPIGSNRTARNIKRIDKKNKVFLSTQMLQNDRIDELISSADIGLCFYRKKRMNDYHTGFSSEKLARYLKCGLPVITFNYPTFIESVEKNKCGVCIADLGEMSNAIAVISSDYSEFRQNAILTYSSFFEFSKQFKRVTDFLDEQL